jgi:signal transduction histidine kinase
MSGGRVLAGAATGALAAVAGFALDQATGQPIFAVLPLLAVALVGLTVGSSAAVATYVVAGSAIVIQGIIGSEALVSTANIARLAMFVIGAPIIVLLALRMERRQEESRAARDSSVAAEQAANRERSAADQARRELQSALQQVERERTRLEEVAEAIPEPLIVYDADGTGTYANRAAVRTFGRSFHERSLQEWGRVADPRDDRGQPLPMSEWPQVRARDEVTRRRMLLRLPMSGRDLLMDVEGTPVPDGGCVLLLRDVGKEVDERRRLSRFASFVAHEMRNPLAVARARIELAAREQADPERGVAHQDRALESVDAAIGILERLELFSRADSGRLKADRLRFDLRDAVAAAVERLHAGGSERVVAISVNGDPIVEGDQQLTAQALTNLLTNADRYSEEAAPIQVEINGGAMPELRVRDGGPGISDDVAALLFRDRVTSGRGLGLGLYLVRAAMEAQGGVARLEERKPAAVFLLRWPRRTRDEEEPGSPEAASAEAGEAAAAVRAEL